MIELSFQLEGSRRKQLKFTTDTCVIGSGRHNDLVIKGRKVAKRHAQIALASDGLELQDLGSMTGTWVNRERIIRYTPLTDDDEIVIGNARLWVKQKNTRTTGHDELTSPSDASGSSQRGMQTDQSLTGEMQTMNSLPGVQQQSTSPNTEDSEQLLNYWRGIIHDQLIAEMDLRRKDVHNMSDAQLRREAENLLDSILLSRKADIASDLPLDVLRAQVLAEAVGLGPLEELLADDSVTEIMVNNHREIFVERAGRLELASARFSSDEAVLAVIERIITPLGRRIDESSPMVDARLKDGSRVNAIVPPLALKGPSLTVRKFSKKRLQFTDLEKYYSVNNAMVEFLRVCVVQRKNIIVAGGTGSGKTTLLNVLSNFIPDRERIVTVEDAAELQLYQPNLVSLEARPANVEGRGQIAIRDLVRNTLRMRPDRIIVGECRGGEALDMLQAMNTGHDGSLTTVHANSPRDVLSRLEVMVLMAGMDLPVSAIREQVSSAIDIVVQQHRYPCGARKISRISGVVGMEGNIIQLQDIFAFQQRGVDADGRVLGGFKATGFIPAFYEQLADIGADVDLGLFSNAEEEGQ